jgi:hypothetical protein
MLTDEKMGKLENVIVNFSAVMMSSMMGALGDMLGGFADAVAKAFDAPLEDAEGNPIEDVSAHIKGALPAEMLEEFAGGEGVEKDEEMWDRVRRKLPEERVDELFRMVESVDCRLPKFTDKLAPEALLGYSYLAQQEDERFARMFVGITEWMEKNGEALQRE